MRNFIDMINKGLLPTPATIETEGTILSEGKNYDAMFNNIEALASRYGQDHIHEQVASCKEIVKALKRNDRQAWAARILRLWLIEQMMAWPISSFMNTSGDTDPSEKQQKFETFKGEIARLDAKYRGEYQKTVGVDYATDSRSDPKAFIKNMILKHYLGIPYSKIQNYVFSKSMTETLSDLSALDSEFKERAKGLLTLEPGDKIIIRMPENYVWVMLDRGYCSVEANAMGHCGNAGAKSGDRILSMRRIKDTIDGEVYMEVFLTFILNGDGYLGEMKGRGNDKPAERYHPQIIELLKNPIVKGIRGGGYMPKNNFSLNDLPDDVREQLLDQYPHLGGWQSRLQRAQKSGGVNKEFLAALLTGVRDSIDWADKAEYTEEGAVSLYAWPDIDDFVDEMSDDDHTKEVAKNDYHNEMYDTPSDDQIESLIDDMPTRWQIAIGQHVLAQMQADGADEDDIEDFDMSSSSDVVSKLDDYDYELKSVLENAVRSGIEQGGEMEAHQALVKAIEKFTPDIGKLEFKEWKNDDGKKGWVWDAPVKLIVSLEAAAKLIDESANNDDEYADDTDLKTTIFGEEELKIDQPYYGYSDFDTDSALERFYEEADLGDLEPKGGKPEQPDWDHMDINEAKAWIEDMYSKIPDGFIRKVHVDTLPDDRIRASAKGLFKTYYG